MGRYLTTVYRGIFKYVGKDKTSYGISYRAKGKFQREIIGPLLGEAKEKLAEKRDLERGDEGQIFILYFLKILLRRPEENLVKNKQPVEKGQNGSFRHAELVSASNP